MDMELDMDSEPLTSTVLWVLSALYLGCGIMAGRRGPQFVLTAHPSVGGRVDEALESQGEGSRNRRALLPRPCRELKLDPNWGQIPWTVNE